jgi:hypothetical protein
MLCLCFQGGTAANALMSDAVTREGEGIVMLSHRLELIAADLTPIEKRCLKYFIDTIWCNRPVVTLARCFPLNRGTIFRIASSIIAFFLVVVQF